MSQIRARFPAPFPSSPAFLPTAFLLLALGVVGCDTPPLVPGPANTAPELEAMQFTESLTFPIDSPERPAGTFRLRERMAHYRVPGVSIAVIDGGELRWAKAWGTLRGSSDPDAAAIGDPVTPESLFQVGSISKALTATLALRVAAEKGFELDQDIDALGPFEPDRPGVTLRGLLRHTAGIGVQSYPGYTADQSLPTLDRILDGQSPASTPAVTVETDPGSIWRYSGGGYSLLERFVEQQSGLDFAQAMEAELFSPLGMESSSFAMPPGPEMLPRIALGHGADGLPLEGGWRLYPERAAAGLWSTATDLAQWVMDLQKGHAGKPARRLKRANARAMLTEIAAGETPLPDAEHWGLGVMIGGVGQARWFGHAGGNAGYAALALGFLSSGHGAVILTNGEGGHALIREIVTALARVHDWPRFRQESRQLFATTPQSARHFRGEWFLPALPEAPLVIHPHPDGGSEGNGSSDPPQPLRASFLGVEYELLSGGSSGLVDPVRGLEIEQLEADAEGHASRLELRLFPGYRFVAERATPSPGPAL